MKVLYRADQETDEVFELFIVDVSVASPGTPQKVSGEPMAGDVRDGEFTFSPDGQSVLYLAGQNVVFIQELYLVDMSGATPGTPLKVNGDLVSGGNVALGGFHFSPDGS